ncbi:MULTISPECIES: hypothetical protein [Arthrobacter]|uniref:Transcriptional regulator, AbiEi antitoxin, Type IV TA system n=2 Tax=Arthrobacter TaxID=1663 RepID=A0ABU9KLK3_9MICC|nr:hypothetical protein [Arthrobacter sp. YJM1]MDP5226978.1 hypothetical protein [Arthrobacter sp. YJM1]
MDFPDVNFLTAGRGPHLRSPRQLSSAFAAGKLVRLRRGVYLPIDEWLSGTAWDRYALTTTALGIAGTPPVFCRETALSLYGFRLADVPQTVEYLTDSRSAWGRKAAPVLYGNPSEAALAWKRVRQGGGGRLPQGFREARRPGADAAPNRLRVAHLGVVLPMQSLDAALLDTLHRMPFADAVVVADAIAAEDPRIKRPCSLEGLVDGFSVLPSLAARNRTREVLDFANSASESVGESYSRAVIHRLGFEVPELQFRVMGSAGEIARTDFLWRSRKLVGEFDGLMKYTRSRELSGKDPAQVVVEEKLREDRIRAEGYGVVRWVWDEVKKPQLLMQKLLRAGVPRR